MAIPQSVSAVIWAVMFRPDGPLKGTVEVLGLSPQRGLTSQEQALASLMLIVSWIGLTGAAFGS